MLFTKIGLKNLLSFGDVELELCPLNVLIGANASGKSNLLRALGLIQSLPKGFAQGLTSGTNADAWANRRVPRREEIEIRLSGTRWSYRIAFVAGPKGSGIISEHYPGVFNRSFDDLVLSSDSKRVPISVTSSVLEVIKHPREQKIGILADRIREIALYREFHTGPQSQARYGIAANALAEHLSEEGNNLSLVLNEVDVGVGLTKINQALNRFSELFSEIKVLTRGGITQLYLREHGVSDAFASTSLSDGTLRFLCLLAILLAPNHPPLICIEEPETGLHPDAIQMVADLLIEASRQTQLIVTTHSPALVDALTGQPESVVVCERDFDNYTTFKRLTKRRLKGWLERYSLGELWQKGEIGGNRW